MTNGKRIVGALAIAIALFFAFPVVLGGFQRIGAFRAAISEREALLAERVKILDNVDAQYAEYSKQTNTDVGRTLAAFVPVRKDSAELISALESMAQQSGIILDEFGVGEALAKKESGKYKTLTISMKLRGSYEGMRTFLENVESYVRLLNVTLLKASLNDSGALSFEVTADAYFLK